MAITTNDDRQTAEASFAESMREAGLPMREDVDSYEQEAITLSATEIAEYLRTTVGAPVTALVAGLSNPSQVSRWIDGARPRPNAEQRLRTAYAAVRVVEHAWGAAAARSWLFCVGSGRELPADSAAGWLKDSRYEDPLHHQVLINALRMIWPQ